MNGKYNDQGPINQRMIPAAPDQPPRQYEPEPTKRKSLSDAHRERLEEFDGLSPNLWKK